MPGFSTRNLTVQIGEHAYRLRVLSEHQQFADPDGHSARLGISSAQWCLFGQLWSAGRLLAQAMSPADIAGKRVLGRGCRGQSGAFTRLLGTQGDRVSEEHCAMDNDDRTLRGRLLHDRRNARPLQ